jgi:3-oxoacyl-[acyl-carrier-protein] synthase II
MRRIAVTGMGAVTPLAADVETSWSRLLAGCSGIRRLPDAVVGDLPAKIGGGWRRIDQLDNERTRSSR